MRNRVDATSRDVASVHTPPGTEKGAGTADNRDAAHVAVRATHEARQDRGRSHSNRVSNTWVPTGPAAYQLVGEVTAHQGNDA